MLGFIDDGKNRVSLWAAVGTAAQKSDMFIRSPMTRLQSIQLIFGVGSDLALLICKEYGLDPDCILTPSMI